ncbi:MAG: hypothetical protein WBB34_17740, partial [Xanthobacteraceae bacterium]
MMGHGSVARRRDFGGREPSSHNVKQHSLLVTAGLDPAVHAEMKRSQPTRTFVLAPSPRGLPDQPGNDEG